MERGLGGHPVGSGAAAGQFSLLTKPSPPTYIVSFCPSLGTDPLHSSPLDRICVLLTPGVFPGHFP